MKKINNYILLGLIINCVFLFINGLNLFPEFIKGLCGGLGITLIFVGIYSEKHDLCKLRKHKKDLFSKMLLK